MNEGWTTWLQRRIMNRIEGVSHDMDLDAIGGVHRLEQDVNLLDKSLTSLYLALGDGDPDEKPADRLSAAITAALAQADQRGKASPA